ncbi:MAG TPA: N-acetylmuramic acid 6-phosphate etherase [Thermoanaerobaculia bacterium]|nr:N-acetylmuramic acid 6-phosphate etherase [Thermoanaerobaculia bacterium]
MDKEMSKDRDERDASPDWESLPTEARHPGSFDLDRLPIEEVVALILEEDRRGLDAALRHRKAIAQAANRLAETLTDGGSILLAGAGTSGRLGVIEAAECPPTFGSDPARIRAVIAGGREAVFVALEGAEDREDEGRRAASGLGPEDLLIGLSASSVTPYTRGALLAARGRGARTILLTCAGPAGLSGLAGLVIALDTGAEVLTGSTRLKAGSATKAVLNAITTAAMVRLGKVFENWMVDLRPGSAKLRDRSVRIVAEAGGVPGRRAEELLAEAEGEVKTALLMARRGIGAGDARSRLAAAAGSVRRALEEAAPLEK